MATITEVDAAVKPAKIALMEATGLAEGDGFHSVAVDDGVTYETTIVRTGDTTLAVTQKLDGMTNVEADGEFTFTDVARLAGQGLLFGVPREQIPLADEFFVAHLDQEELELIAMITGETFGVVTEAEED